MIYSLDLDRYPKIWCRAVSDSSTLAKAFAGAATKLVILLVDYLNLLLNQTHLTPLESAPFLSISG